MFLFNIISGFSKVFQGNVPIISFIYVYVLSVSKFYQE